MNSIDTGKVSTSFCERSKIKLGATDEIKTPNASEVDGMEREGEHPLQLCPFPYTGSKHQPHMLPVLPIPKVEYWCANTSIVLTGTACKGAVGPPVGTVDIGVSKLAYYFCIALPGVKKDPGEFSIEIQQDGRVCVKGVTSTGGRTVTKFARVFEMKFQQQCSPGPFSLFFSLPGPVDPRLFSPIFRSDGILEGVIAKHEQLN